MESAWPGTWRAATAYLLVGSLAGVNAAIGGYPVFGAQALRYTLASAALAAACLLQRRRGLLPRLTGRLTRREITLLTVQATFGGDRLQLLRGRGGPAHRSGPPWAR